MVPLEVWSIESDFVEICESNWMDDRTRRKSERKEQLDVILTRTNPIAVSWRSDGAGVPRCPRPIYGNMRADPFSLLNILCRLREGGDTRF